MNLNKKKMLVSRTLDVGKNRISFNQSMLSEINEAITKQDIKDLVKTGAIIINEPSGRLKKPVRKTRRGIGSVKKKVNTSKQDYVKLTRKLRDYAKRLLEQDKISKDHYKTLRKEIRAKQFRSMSNMKERIKEGVA